MSAELLAIFSLEKRFNRFGKFIKRDVVDAATWSLFSAIKDWHNEKRGDIEWSKFAVDYKLYNPKAKDLELLILDQLSTDNPNFSEDYMEGLIKRLVTRDYAKQLADRAIETLDGGDSLDSLQTIFSQYQLETGAVEALEQYIVSDDLESLYQDLEESLLYYPWKDLNKSIGALHKGRLMYIAARPNCLAGHMDVEVMVKPATQEKRAEIRMWSLKRLFNWWTRATPAQRAKIKIRSWDKRSTAYVFKHIRGVYHSGTKHCISLDFDTQRIICTNDHKLAYSKRPDPDDNRGGMEWRAAGDFRLDDRVYTDCPDHGCYSTKLHATTNVGEFDCYDIEMEDQTNPWFICNGVLVHNCGKSTMATQIATNAVKQLAPDQICLWFTNEEDGRDVKFRHVQSTLNATSERINQDRLGAVKEYNKRLKGEGRIVVIDKANMHRNDIEYFLRKFDGRVGLIVIDQLWKVGGFDNDMGVEGQRQKAQWAREIAKTVAPVISTHQLKGEAEGKPYPTMDMLYGSTTAIQGEADVILFIGQNPEDADDLRHISIGKVKGAAGKYVDSKYRNGKFIWSLDGERGRFKEGGV